jgi:hypothetical protein
MIKNKGKLKTIEERLAEYERMLRLNLEAEEEYKRGSRLSLPVLSVDVRPGGQAGAAGD